jgi:uncharacterized BrkB/YihY/UPF0761 family membrane protein
MTFLIELADLLVAAVLAAVTTLVVAFAVAMYFGTYPETLGTSQVVAVSAVTIITACLYLLGTWWAERSEEE